MVAISPEEDEELRDLFDVQGDQADDVKFGPLIKTYIPELRDVLADFFYFTEQYHVGEAPQARKYYPGDLSFTQGTNDSSLFSDPKMDDSRQTESMMVYETDLIAEYRSDATVRTDKTDVIQASVKKVYLNDACVVQEPELNENTSVFTNPDAKPEEVEVFEVRAAQEGKETAQSIKNQMPVVIDVYDEKPVALKLPVVAAKPEVEESTDILVVNCQDYLSAEDLPLVIQAEGAAELAPSETVYYAAALESIYAEPVVYYTVEQVVEPIVQDKPELATAVIELQEPNQQEPAAIAQQQHVKTADSIGYEAYDDQNKQELYPEAAAIVLLEEKKERKRSKGSKKETTKLEVPGEVQADTQPYLPVIDENDKPPQIKQPGKTNAEEKEGLLLSTVQPKEVYPQDPAKLSVQAFFQASYLRYALIGHEMRKAEHEIRKNSSPIRQHYTERTESRAAATSPDAQTCSLLQPKYPFAGSPHIDYATPVYYPSAEEVPISKETPLSAKERMERLLNSLERSVTGRGVSEPEEPAQEFEINAVDSQFSSMIRSGMMTEIQPKDEEVIENVELLATPTEIIGYQFRREIFRIPIFSNRILIDDARRIITLLGNGKKYKLPSATFADHQFRKEKLQALFRYETLENLPKTPVFRIDVASQKMQIVENGITTSFGFDEIEYDSFRGGSGFVKMRANGYIFVYKGSEEQVEKLVRCLQDAGAHMTFLESSMSHSQTQ